MFIAGILPPELKLVIIKAVNKMKILKEIIGFIGLICFYLFIVIGEKLVGKNNSIRG
jgi:hypothetical protein